LNVLFFSYNFNYLKLENKKGFLPHIFPLYNLEEEFSNEEYKSFSHIDFSLLVEVVNDITDLVLYLNLSLILISLLSPK